MGLRVDVRPIGTSGMVVLTEARRRRLGREGRIPITVEVGWETFRTSLVHMDDTWCFVANAKMHARGLTPGRHHVVEIARDEKPRVVTPPPELAAALAAVPGARESWDALPWYHRRETADYVAEAKRPDTRERRAAGLFASTSADGLSARGAGGRRSPFARRGDRSRVGEARAGTRARGGRRLRGRLRRACRPPRGPLRRVRR